MMEIEDMTVENFRKELKKLKLTSTQFTPKENLVLKYRWGVYFYPIFTLEETGKKLGVSRERIRQIENRIVSKVRDCVAIMKED